VVCAIARQPPMNTRSKGGIQCRVFGGERAYDAVCVVGEVQGTGQGIQGSGGTVWSGQSGRGSGAVARRRISARSRGAPTQATSENHSGYFVDTVPPEGQTKRAWKSPGGKRA
jgi:hypothetical protein